jgi:hypothetical protein
MINLPTDQLSVDMKGDDNWQVGGTSWHWPPVTPDVAYEYKDVKK